jgi:hypothetical protein
MTLISRRYPAGSNLWPGILGFVRWCEDARIYRLEPGRRCSANPPGYRPMAIWWRSSSAHSSNISHNAIVRRRAEDENYIAREIGKNAAANFGAELSALRKATGLRASNHYRTALSRSRRWQTKIASPANASMLAPLSQIPRPCSRDRQDSSPGRPFLSAVRGCDGGRLPTAESMVRATSPMRSFKIAAAKVTFRLDMAVQGLGRGSAP